MNIQKLLNFCLGVALITAQVLTIQTNTVPAALAEVVQRMFATTREVFNFFIECENVPDREKHFLRIFEGTLRRLRNVPVIIGMHQKLPYMSNEGQYDILAVDSAISLQNMYNCTRMNLRHFNVDHLVYIYLKTFESHYYDELEAVLRINSNLGLANVNVIVEPQPGLVLMYTYFPYTPHSCRKVHPVIINRFKNSKWLRRTFHQNKLKNFYGCSLNCVTWKDAPYVRLLENVSDIEVSGIVGKVINFLKVSMNFTLNCTIVRSQSDAGFYFKVSDIIVAVNLNRLEVMYNSLIASPAFSFEHIILVISAHREMKSRFTNLLLPFKRKVWLGLIATYGIGIGLIASLRFLKRKKRLFVIGRRNNNPIYNLIIVTVGGGVHRSPDQNFARFLLCCWILVALVLRSVYQSALYNLMRAGVFKPFPNTIEDVRRKGYNIVAHRLHLCRFLEGFRCSTNTSILNGDNVHSYLKEKAIAVLTTRGYINRFRQLHKQQASSLHVVKEKVVTTALTITARKSSGLSRQALRKIGQFNDFGYSLKDEKWSRNSIMQSDQFEKRTWRMSVEDLFDAFLIIVIGSVVGLLVFGLEIFVHKHGERLSKNWAKLRRLCGGKKFPENSPE